MTQSNLSYTRSMVDLMAFSVETPKIDSGCSWIKEFTELIHMNL